MVVICKVKLDFLSSFYIWLDVFKASRALIVPFTRVVVAACVVPLCAFGIAFDPRFVFF